VARLIPVNEDATAAGCASTGATIGRVVAPQRLDLTPAWNALRQADWTSARDAFAARLEEAPDDPEALDGLGRALWWLGHPQEGIERRRQAYAEYKRRGDTLQAANLATYLAAEHRIAGEPAAASGWLARAERLLEHAPPCAERGWLEIEHAKRVSGDPARREEHAKRAANLGRELRDADLEAAALAQLGLARVDTGDLPGGMALLDEAMAAATGGEAVDPLAIGDTCCTTLVACDRLADFERAAEWCRAVVEFTGRRGYTPLHLWCRTIYAGVLIATGDWERADAELLTALRGYDELGSPGRVFALARLAELRVRQGRLGEAEKLLAGHEDHPLTIVPAVGLAVARGRPALACALVGRRLDAAADDEGKLAALLPACVDARLASGDLDGAAAAAERVRELGERLERDNLTALADLGSARVAAARGEGEEARLLLGAAIAGFDRLGMPLEEGRARLERARLEEGELALVDARAALSIFESLEARRDADAAAALLRELGASGRSGRRIEGELTAREREVLDLLGEGLSNQAIADRLYISPKTAEHHVSRILGKLGLRSRAEAAAHAVRGGFGGG
jgi:DNA-binding CsgD family transcriptional regulator